MKKKNHHSYLRLVALITMALLLATCSPAKTAIPTAMSPPTETAPPSSVSTHTPKPDPTATATAPAPTPVPPTSTPTPPPPEPTQEPRSIACGAFGITMTTNPQDNSLTDVYVKNLETGEEKLHITLPDIYVNHYHNSEYHNGNLYIIRRIGYNGHPDEEWADELWKYDSHQKGTKLFAAKGLDFRVAPDEKLVALEKDQENLILLDPQGNPTQEFAIDQLGGHDEKTHPPLPAYLFLDKWSDDSRELWGEVSAGPSPLTFYKIEVASGQITTYDVSPLAIPWEYDLNANTGKLVYSDFPQMYVADDAEELKKSQQQITLFVHDLDSQSTQAIVTSVAKDFAPQWLDDSTIEYNDPDGDDRIVYVIPGPSSD